MFLDLREIIDKLFFLFLLFVQRIILLSDVFDKFDDSFIVIVIDTVLNLIVMNESIEVVQKWLEHLRDTVFNDSSLHNFADN
jgi:hypothetical protein